MVTMREVKLMAAAVLVVLIGLAGWHLVVDHRAFHQVLDYLNAQAQAQAAQQAQQQQHAPPAAAAAPPPQAPTPAPTK